MQLIIKKNSTAATRANGAIEWGYADVIRQAKNYEAIEDKEGQVIAAINGDFYQKGASNGKTEGKLIIEGKTLNPSVKEPFFAVLRDGTYTMRSGSSDAADVQEAIAGKMWVVKNGMNKGSRAHEEWSTLAAVGLSAGGDVIVVCVDGRSAGSAGMKVVDLGEIMLKQGCKDAILLDCGGSASFITKRPEECGLRMRNTPNDGAIRNVSSALLVVKRDRQLTKPEFDNAACSMAEEDTRLIKTAGCYYYTFGGKNVPGFRSINNEQYLFSDKGRGLTATVKLGDAKYYYKKGKLVKCSDKNAGRVSLGFCGASNKGQNLLFAYHYGDKKLNIGLNPLIKKNSGKMKDWKEVKDVPWVSEIRFIKSVHIGKGVLNIGSYAFYISRDPFNDNVRNLGSKLSAVKLPASIRVIGRNSIYNNRKLKKLTIPEHVRIIKKGALAYNENTEFVFKSKTPPRFYGKTFTTVGEKTIVVAPHTKSWESSIGSADARRSAGLSGKVILAKYNTKQKRRTPGKLVR